MKKILLGLILIIFYNCSVTNTENSLTSIQKDKKTNVSFDFAGTVETTDIDFLKKNYNWNDERILIINYSQPISSCHFNNNTNSESSKKWWENFYSKINTENCKNIKVLSNGERVKGKLDNIKYFDDKDDFLLKKFFDRKKSCFGVLVINTDGDYIQFNGHYSERQVARFIEFLR